MHYMHVVCSVQCSICSRECTCSDSGAFAGSGAVCSVQCAGCSVLPAKDEDLTVEKG